VLNLGLGPVPCLGLGLELSGLGSGLSFELSGLGNNTDVRLNECLRETQNRRREVTTFVTDILRIRCEQQFLLQRLRPDCMYAV